MRDVNLNGDDWLPSPEFNLIINPTETIVTCYGLIHITPEMYINNDDYDRQSNDKIINDIINDFNQGNQPNIYGCHLEFVDCDWFTMKVVPHANYNIDTDYFLADIKILFHKHCDSFIGCQF